MTKTKTTKTTTTNRTAVSAVNNSYNNSSSSSTKEDKVQEKLNSFTIMDDYQPKTINIGFDPIVNYQQHQEKQYQDKENSERTSNIGMEKRKEELETTTKDLKSQHSHRRTSSIDSVELTFSKRNSLNQSEAKDILVSQIEIREKEIERQIRFAEKDKKDSLLYINLIKEFKELLLGYIKDFYNSEENCDRKSRLIERSNALSAIESVSSVGPMCFSSISNNYNTNNSTTTPSSNTDLNNSTNISSSSSNNSNNFICSNSIMDGSFNTISPTTSVGSTTSSAALSNNIPSYLLGTSVNVPSSSLSFWEQQNQLNQNSASQHKNDEKSNGSVSLLVSSYQNKDEELERVRARANNESVRASSLKERYMELTQLVQEEREHWRAMVSMNRKQLESKEKEINRLLMVAESQKKKSMETTDQITRLKKSLSCISQIRANNTNIDIKKVNEKCSFESLSPSPNLANKIPLSPVHYPITSSNNNCKISPSSTSSTSPTSSSSSKYSTEEKKELVHLERLNEKKDEELRRIKDIIDFEYSKTQFLTNKVTELKLILEEESRQVELLQNQTLREIREKEDAIIRVALRAHKERIKSNQLNDQIKKLSKAIQHPNGLKETPKQQQPPQQQSQEQSDQVVKKTPELEPIGINFMEMGELKQFQDLSLNPYCDENILNNCCMGKLPISSLLSTSLQQQQQHQQQQQQQSPTLLANQSNSSVNFGSFSSPTLINSPKSSIPANSTSNQALLNSPTLIVRNQMNSVVSNSISIPASHKLYPTGESPSSYPHHGSSGKSPRPSSFSNYSTSPSSLIPGLHSSYQQSAIVGSPSEVIMFKLKEIERLSKETLHKEQELNQVKKIAEAERSRLCLLKDKYKELRSEILDRDTLYSEKYATKTY